MTNYPLTIPTAEEAIAAAAERARRHIAKQALMSAGATLIPVPGVDMLVDVTVMVKMIDRINAEFCRIGINPAKKVADGTRFVPPLSSFPPSRFPRR